MPSSVALPHVDTDFTPYVPKVLFTNAVTANQIFLIIRENERN